MIWLWIVLLIMLLIVLILLSPIQGQLFFARSGERDNFWFQSKLLYGLIRFRYTIPSFQFQGLWEGIDWKQQTTKPGLHASTEFASKHLTAEDVFHIYLQARQLLHHVDGFNLWARHVIRRIHCSKLTWVTQLGTGGAPETAFLTGAGWILKTSILITVARFIRLIDTPQLEIVPQYHRRKFSTEFSCIMKIRLGDAMLAGLFLLIRILKVKGGIRVWQSILFKG